MNIVESVRYAGEIPPAAQLPMILWTPRRRRSYRRRGRFLFYPEELSGTGLFPKDGYSPVALGRC